MRNSTQVIKMKFGRNGFKRTLYNAQFTDGLTFLERVKKAS